MATFKAVILPSHKKEDGSYNLKVRVIHNRKAKYIRTPYYVDSKEMTRKKSNGKETLKIKNQALLDLMDETIMGYKKKLVALGNTFESWSVERVVDYLTSEPKSFSLNFIKYGKEYVELVKNSGRVSTAKKYDVAINALIRFVGRDTLDVSEINYKFLKSFESHLRSEPVYKGVSTGDVVVTDKMKKGRAVSSYISLLKTIYEHAKDEFNDEDCGVINIPYSPFKKYKIPAVPAPEHRTLTVEQIQAIIDLPYKRETLRGRNDYNIAKDVFLISFVLMGINTADLFEENSMNRGIFVYNRRKTRTRRKDKAEMRIRIEPQVKNLIEKYRGSESVFMFGEHYSTPINFNKVVNQGLKKVGKDIGVPNLTYYYARHSMASICANKLGIDIARVDEMLNHSDPKLALSRVYIERDFNPLWEANKRLLDLFDWSFYEKGE